MFDESSSRYDGVAAFYGIGFSAECLDADGAIRRGVVACAAHHSVRALRRDEKISDRRYFWGGRRGWRRDSLNQLKP